MMKVATESIYIGTQQRTGFHRAVWEALKTLTDSSLDGLNTDITGTAETKFTLDGIRITVKSLPPNPYAYSSHWTYGNGAMSYLDISVGEFYTLQFRSDHYSSPWILVVQDHQPRPQQSTNSFYGPVKEWRSPIVVLSVIEKLVEACQELPQPRNMIENFYAQNTSYQVDKFTTVTRGDYESDKAFVTAVHEACEDAVVQWSASDSRFATNKTKAIEGFLGEVEVPGVEVSDKNITIPYNCLAGMTKKTRSALRKLRTAYKDPPKSEFVTEKSVKSGIKKKANELCGVHNDLWKTAAHNAGLHYVETPNLSANWRN